MDDMSPRAGGPGSDGWVLLSDDVIVDATESVAKLLGVPHADLVGARVAEFLTADSADRLYGLMADHDPANSSETTIRMEHLEPTAAPMATIEWSYLTVIPGSGWLIQLTYRVEPGQWARAAG